MNVDQLRADFPILHRQIDGRPIVYLDSAATSQKPRAVIDTLVRYYSEYNANVHRAVYKIGEEATAAYEGARATVAQFIGSPTTDSVIFTRNATEAINLVAQTWGRVNVHEGDELLLTPMEHHSNLVPWQILAGATGAKIRTIPMTTDGLLDLSSLPSLISERTRLVAVTQMSNVLGTINPVKTIADAAHRVGATVLVDGAQSVAHMGADVSELGADFLVFSAHKMCGPTGVGVLWGRRDLLDAMPPFMGGGDMIRQVWLDRSSYNDLPWKFEAGTPNVADVIAFGTAVEYMESVGMDAVRAHEADLTRHALAALEDLPGVTVYGPRDPELRGGLVSFNVDEVHAHDLATLVDRDNICIRAGHHCCQPLMRALEVTATARASFYLYNTIDEIDALVRSIHVARRIFTGVPV